MLQMLDYNDADGGGEQVDAAADDAAALQQAAEAAAGAVKAEEAADSAAGAGGDAMQTTTEVRSSMPRRLFGAKSCTAGMVTRAVLTCSYVPEVVVSYGVAQCSGHSVDLIAGTFSSCSSSWWRCFSRPH